MLTLEVYGKFISWPEEFALMMMRYYQNYGVPFIVHRDCINTGSNSPAAGSVPKCAAPSEAQDSICCHQHL
jgi:hypothetical protein